MKRAIVILVLLLGGISSLHPIHNPWKSRIKFQHFSNKDGLIHNTIHCLYQDSTGFLWIGTLSGLDRFDGHEFRHYPIEQSSLQQPDSTSIGSIAEGPDQRIWIAQRRNGFDCFDPRTERYSRYDYPDSLANKNNPRFNTILVPSFLLPGTVWIGTRFGQILRIRPDQIPMDCQSVTPAQEVSGPLFIQSLCPGSGGILWIGSNRGLWQLQEKSEDNRFRRFGTGPSPLDELSINKITIDSNGFLWLAHQQGVIRFDPRERVAIQIYPILNAQGDPQNIVDLVLRPDGRLWLATRSSGLVLFDPQSGTPIFYQNHPNDPNSLSIDSCTTLCQGQNGLLWVGTYTGGLNKYDPLASRFPHLYKIVGREDALSGKQVKALARDSQGAVWVGGEHNQGLNRLDPVTGAITQHYHQDRELINLSGMRALALQFDQADNPWLSNNDRVIFIDRINKTTRTFRNRPDDETSLSANLTRVSLMDRQQRLWLGTMQGLDCLDTRNGRLTHFRQAEGSPETPTPNVIRALYEDPQGGLWAGGESSLWQFNPARSAFRAIHIRPEEHQSPLAVYAIHQSRDDPRAYWIGTDRRGLFLVRIETGRILKWFHLGNGMPDNHIYAIAEDQKGRIWTSTNKGIACIDPVSGEIHGFDTSDGIQEEEFNSACLVREDGLIFMGGQNGLNIFDPHEIELVHTAIRPRITDFQIFNRSQLPAPDGLLKHTILTTDQLELNYDDSVFSFEFNALDLSAPQKINYRYKMEGFDHDWVSTTAKRRFTTYTNMTPGRYRFRVQASNRDGFLSGEETAIRITVRPPFWKTLWFKVFMTLLALSALGLIQFLFLRRQKRKEAYELETERRMVALTESIRSQIGMELHDGLSHDLLAIHIKLKIAGKGLPHSESLTELETMLRSAVSKTKRIARGLFPINLAEYGLPQMLVELAQKVETEFDLRCLCQTEQTLRPQSPATLAHLYHIAGEAVYNAARHAAAGQIEICLQQDERSLTLTVRDDGHGLPDLRAGRAGMGLRIMNHRARLMGAVLSIGNHSEGGVEVRCTLPLDSLDPGDQER